MEEEEEVTNTSHSSKDKKTFQKTGIKTAAVKSRLVLHLPALDRGFTEVLGQESAEIPT